eukprot:8945492-Pyramimonas_sp.AAC.1
MQREVRRWCCRALCSCRVACRMTEKCWHVSVPIGVVRRKIWVRDMLPRRRPARAREVDAAPAHTLCGFAHLPRGGQGKQVAPHVDAAMRTA